MKSLFAKIPQNLIWIFFFSIGMGALEAIVVVYLRQLYYPEGFEFPLALLSQQFISVEILREIATIVMLAAVGIIAGKTLIQRFSYFLFAFAIWDIFYYAWLKILLDWPASFLTWDVLFLIPVTWVGPVLAPIICSITMIIFAENILIPQHQGKVVTTTLFDWVLTFLGSFMIFCTFIWDYTKIIFQGGFMSKLGSLAENQEFWNIMSSYEPEKFNWLLFSIGEILIFVAIFLIFRRIKGHAKS